MPAVPLRHPTGAHVPLLRLLIPRHIHLLPHPPLDTPPRRVLMTNMEVMDGKNLKLDPVTDSFFFKSWSAPFGSATLVRTVQFRDLFNPLYFLPF